MPFYHELEEPEYTSVTYNDPALQPLVFDSYDQNNPRLQRLRAMDFNTSVGEAALFSVGGTAVSAFDTLVSSFGITDDDAVEEWLADAHPEFANFFLRHRDTFQVTGDLASLVLTGGVAGAAMRTTGFIGKGLTRVFGDRVTPFLSTGKSAKELSEKAARRAEFLARQPAAQTFRFDKEFIAAKKAVGRRRFADAMIEAVGAEAAIAATMHDSEFLFPDEMSVVENIVFAGGANLIFGGAVLAHARWAATRAAKEAAAPHLVRGRTESGLPPAAGRSTRAETRVSAAVHAETMKYLNDMAPETEEGISNVAHERTAAMAAFRESIDLLARKNPAFDFNAPEKWTREEMETLLEAAPENADLIARMHSYGRVHPEGGRILNDFETRAAEQSADLQVQLEAKSLKLKEINDSIEASGEFMGTHAQYAAQRNLQNEIADIREKQTTLQATTTVVLEAGGGITVGSRNRTFQDGARSIHDGPNSSKVTRLREHETRRKEQTEIAVDHKGGVKISRRSCRPGASLSRNSITALTGIAVSETIGMPAILASLQLKTAEDMTAGIRRLKSFTGSDVVAEQDETVIRLRDALREDANIPDEMTLYAHKNTDDVKLRYEEDPVTGYTRPVTVQVDDIQGVDQHFIYANIDDKKALTGADYQYLSQIEKTAVLDTMQAQLEKRAEGPVDEIFNPLHILRGNRNPHWTEVDYMLERIQQAPNKDDLRQFEPDLSWQSLRSKFTDFQVLRTRSDRFDALARQERNGARGAYGATASGYANLARALNLPTESSLLDFFETLRVENTAVDLEKVFPDKLEGFTKALRQQFEIPNEEPVKAPLPIRGNMMNIPRNRRPVIGYVDNRVAMDEDLRRGLSVLAAQERKAFLTQLEQADTPVIGTLMGLINKNPKLILSMKQGLMQLIDGNSVSGKIQDNVVQRHFARREDPGVEQLDTMVANIIKQWEQATKQVFEKPTTHTDVSGKQLTRNDILTSFTIGLNDSDKRASRATFHMFREMRAQGWDINEGTVQRIDLADGKARYQFVVGNSEKNRKMFQELYGKDGRAFDSTTPIPVPGFANTPLTVTEEALRVIRTISDIGRELLLEANTLRTARGQTPIKEQSFWLPSRAMTEEKFQSFLIGEAGQLVRVVTDLTEAGLASRVQKEIANSQEPLFAVSKNTLQLYSGARGAATYNMQDLSSTIRQTGPRTGRSAQQVFDHGVEPFQEVWRALLRNGEDIRREFLLEIFDPEIQMLRQRHHAVGIGPKEDTVYSQTVKMVTGTQDLDINTHVGRGYLWFSNMYDRVLAQMFGWRQGDLSQREADKTVASLNDAIGKGFNPFENGLKYIERTHKVQIPGTLRKHAAVLSEATAAAAIRAIDIGMAVVNIASLAVTLPPVVRMALPRRSEGDAEWQARVSAFGGVTPGNKTPWLSPTKIMVNGFRWMLTHEGKAIREIAEARGYMDQYAAEAVGIYDRAGQSFAAKVIRDSVDKISVLTDRTERMARGIAFMSFYNLGTKGFGLDMEAAMVFAHKQANNTIADFRPNDRPTIFQGATGMPLALFTTYMWNYLQRLYRIVETADAQAAASQVGTMTALFGVNSMPGAQAFIQSWGANEDGTLNVEDRIAQVIGRGATDVLMHGTISTFLPRAVGFGGGVDIGSRAGIGLPFSRLVTGDIIGEPSNVWENLWKIAPGLQFLGRINDTFWRSVDRVTTEGGFDPYDAAEILATANVNKGLTNAMELAMNHSLDYAGNTIESRTRTWLGIASRVTGFKPLRTSQTREELRRINNIRRSQSAMKQKLGDYLQSELRNGTLTYGALDETLGDYVKAGGSPRNFRNWFLAQVEKGTHNVLDLALAEAVQQNDAQERVGRLLFLMQDEY